MATAIAKAAAIPHGEFVSATQATHNHMHWPLRAHICLLIRNFWFGER